MLRLIKSLQHGRVYVAVRVVEVVTCAHIIANYWETHHAGTLSALLVWISGNM